MVDSNGNVKYATFGGMSTLYKYPVRVILHECTDILFVCTVCFSWLGLLPFALSPSSLFKNLSIFILFFKIPTKFLIVSEHHSPVTCFDVTASFKGHASLARAKRINS